MKIAELENEYRQTYQLNGYVSFDCGEGWTGILEEMLQKLKPHFETGVRLSQVKEKFGTLRVYLDYANEDAYKIINEAELKSAYTCEQCGEHGKEWDDGWIRTLCSACHRDVEAHRRLRDFADAVQIPVKELESDSE